MTDPDRIQILSHDEIVAKVWWRRRPAGGFAARHVLLKSPPGRLRHEDPISTSKQFAAASIIPI
jgi:hypothetical protein